ncbi:peptidoglycan-associated lipoprotein Pal [Azospirillum sp. CT11-132]|uniref:peptidoglycan-associated lipoprotein Pal n=1 Tax=unclassified Azospirillum TaxID=2630922 RepID=UPI000D609BB2|nr:MULTISPECIES: peptidoglycan-associated lipoprotein Pal [unclassified Azospirillum]KAA0570674.1 peptidoglycan-associated lipoprotein Pal [Azospirillum sp. Sh1]MCM8733231.1 peptidoglycan-associated lipoprotein Pal [Azospirillum sp. A1-3]PWC64207.1 cell envelope biogenesis protein OmpA [Azospirillum sp. TSH7]PWC69363.1 cell envelope biogenesis protein OmpA [Azospirillum sp. TSH20]PWC89630.1 cell envelope biogenesis protein OmpA [Azospirillum sp. TSO5]
MRMKFLALAAVALLAACESTPNDAANGANTGAQQTSVRPGSAEDFVVNVGDRVFFGLDRFDLSPEARATLDRQAKWLQTYGSVTVTVEGHADERGTREYNLALGERRANSVKNYLAAKGIPAGRVNVVSYGKERPAVVGSNEAAWSQNRRGVTVVN